MPTIEQAKNWYPVNDAVHGFDHVLRVLVMAEQLALAEGADLEIVRAAVLLHDAQDPASNDIEYNRVQQSPINNPQSSMQRSFHHLTSAELAGAVLTAEGWPAERIAAVQHCIRAHRFRDDREQPETLEAKVLFDADKLDAIGGIGAARAIAYAAQAGQPAYAQPSRRFLETGQAEPDEPHSAYHEYVFKLSKLPDRLYTPAARQIGAERQRYLKEFFIRLAAEIAGNSWT
jgi:uncharacterized protein